MNENIRRLEEKIAYLERHVTEQDKAMLEFSAELTALRREVRRWQEQAANRSPGGADSATPEDERPPHY